MNYQLFGIWGLFAAVIVAIYLMLFSKQGHAQAPQCWPDMVAVRTSMEDLQHVRVELEEQSTTLKSILLELKRRK